MHPRPAEGVHPLGHPVGDRDDLARAADGEAFESSEHGHHHPWRTGGGTRVGPDVRGVVDVGSAAAEQQTLHHQGRAHHGTGGGRWLDHDDVGPRDGPEPERERHVEAEVGQVAADIARGVAQHRPAPHDGSGHIALVIDRAAGRGCRGEHLDLGSAGEEGPDQGRQPEGRRGRLRGEDAAGEHHAGTGCCPGAHRPTPGHRVIVRAVAADSSMASTTVRVCTPSSIETTGRPPRAHP